MGLALIKFFTEISEQFVDPLRPERPPLSGDQGLLALNRAEIIDQYRSTVKQSVPNIIARHQYTYMPTVHSVPIPIPPADPTQPWPNGQVVWMNSSADGGLPHTRAPFFICLPESINTKTLATTLLHERIHVSQRLHPKAWIDLMQSAWSMTPWIDSSLPQEIQSRLRINPDLLGAPHFLWKNEWVPLGIFKSINKPVLSEIDIIWWNPTTRTVHRESPPGWDAYFGKNPAGEHPYEIAAYLIASSVELSNIPAYQALKSRLGSLPRNEI